MSLCKFWQIVQFKEVNGNWEITSLEAFCTKGIKSTWVTETINCNSVRCQVKCIADLKHFSGPTVQNGIDIRFRVSVSLQWLFVNCFYLFLLWCLDPNREPEHIRLTCSRERVFSGQRGCSLLIFPYLPVGLLHVLSVTIPEVFQMSVALCCSTEGSKPLCSICCSCLGAGGFVTEFQTTGQLLLTVTVFQVKCIADKKRKKKYSFWLSSS